MPSYVERLHVLIFFLLPDSLHAFIAIGKVGRFTSKRLMRLCLGVCIECLDPLLLLFLYAESFFFLFFSVLVLYKREKLVMRNKPKTFEKRTYPFAPMLVPVGGFLCEFLNAFDFFYRLCRISTKNKEGILIKTR
jgi:hypothetical protein